MRWAAILVALGALALPVFAEESQLLPLDADQRMVPIAVDGVTANLLAANGLGARVSLFQKSVDGTLTPLVENALVLGLEGGDVVFLEVSAVQSLDIARAGRTEDIVVQLTAAPDAAVVAERRAEDGKDLALSLEPGTRAFAITVDVSAGVSGFLRPGDRVDIYWTGPVPGSDPENAATITRLVLTNAELLALDEVERSDAITVQVRRAVTVQVSPQEVAQLAQAQATGRLSLALVGSAADEQLGAIEVNQNDLLGIEAPPPLGGRTCSMRTRRGTEIIDVPIPCGPGNRDNAGEWPGPRIP